MTIGEKIKQLREKNKMTQTDVAARIGTATQTVFKYEKGIVTNIPLDTVEKIAAVFGVSPAYLMGWDTAAEPEYTSDIRPYKQLNIKKIPIIGEIACGKPVLATETFGDYIESDIQADYALTCRGDSMTGARIYNGDLVFIRCQSAVDNGDIAAVIIEDEVTLKRVYYYPEKQKLVLSPENPAYAPLVFIGSEINDIHILGKAIAFQSRL